MAYKTCTKCEEECGVRTKTCPNCGQKFATKTLKKTKKGIPIDWKSLVKGDRIKILKGSGPYFQAKNVDKHSMGYHGNFTVHRINLDGIIVCGKFGYGYVYMGEKDYCAQTGIIKVPHKIRKID